MAGAAGPNTAESGLVFAYDTGNTVTSYIGEPSTNLALFGMQGSFNADYAGVTFVDDPGRGYQGRDAKRITANSGQWNIYRYPRPGNYTDTSSGQFTYSFKIKWADGHTPYFSNGYIYVDAIATYPGITVRAIDDGWFWCYCTYNGTSSPPRLTGFSTSDNGICWVCDWQLEPGLLHPTPYITPEGTRSATQGLLDLGGSSSIDLTNVSFNADAQIVFDGTNDRIALTPTNYGITNQFTIEVVCYPTQEVNGMFNFLGNNGSDRGIMAHWPWSSDYGYLDITNTDGGFFRWYKVNAGILNVKAMYHFILNPDGQVVVKQNNQVMVPDGTTPFSGTVSLGLSNTIGAFYANGSTAWGGSIYMFKIYKRALTDAETTQNYEAVRKRFGI